MDRNFKRILDDAFIICHIIECVVCADVRVECGDKPVTRAGRPCYDIRFEVNSLKSLDFLYRVRDRYRTLVDIDGIFPWAFQQSIREGGFSKEFTASFDHFGQTARTTEGTYAIPKFVHDIVSAFYYVRSIDLRSYKQGEVLYLQNFFDRETHDLAALNAALRSAGLQVLGLP